MTAENVLIVGATSGMARALAGVMAARGCRLLLAGRNLEETQRVADDLSVRHGDKVGAVGFEATEFESHPAFFEQCLAHFGGELDCVVVCHGMLPDEEKARVDFNETRRAFEVNFLSAAAVLNLAANYFEERGRGTIAGISSVAGDRGRQSNYTYGAAKAALSTYLAGLRNRLQPAGVAVVTIKPGFVDTAMTKGLLDPKSPLVASPERVAAIIDRAIRRRRNIVYAPWFWRVIMTIICSIPEPIFKRLKM